MKLNYLLLSILLGMSFSCSRTPKYTINGEVDNFHGKVFLLALQQTEKMDTLQSVDVQNGVFEFQGNVETPLLAWIQIDGARKKIPFILEGSSYTFKANFDDQNTYTLLGGGELQQLRESFKTEVEEPIQKERDSLRVLYNEAAKNNDLFRRLNIKHEYDSIVGGKYDEKENAFIKENDNLAAVSLLYERKNTLLRNKSFSKKFDLLGENVQNLPAVEEMRQAADIERSIIVGGTAPDFTLQTPSGESVSLYDIKAKVKILDFWASWCGPCRAENPNVKNIYEKYHNKGLEIVGVSLDVSKEKWVDAIEKDDLPWIHLSDLKGWESLAAKQYGVSGIPFVLLLDENNKILDSGLRGKRLEDRIAELLD